MSKFNTVAAATTITAILSQPMGLYLIVHMLACLSVSRITQQVMEEFSWNVCKCFGSGTRQRIH